MIANQCQGQRMKLQKLKRRCSLEMIGKASEYPFANLGQ